MTLNSRQFSDQASFLWSLLHLYFVKNSMDELRALASSMYDQNFIISAELESILLKLQATGDVECITEIAKEVVKQKLFDMEKTIFTVAILVEHRKIDIADAAQLLVLEAPRDYARLDNRIKRVVDVMWLITEDSQDGRLLPNDDSLLKDALKDVATLYS